MTEPTGPAGPHGHGKRVHLNVEDNVEDLIFATESGLIWQTEYANLGVAAIQSGQVDLAKCKNVPDEVVDLLTASK